MKGLQIAVVLLVLSISSLEALVCNNCSGINQQQCISKEETCRGRSDVCVHMASVNLPQYIFFKRCMNPIGMRALVNTGVYQALENCSTDRCN